MKPVSDAKLRRALNAIFRLNLCFCVLLDGLLEIRQCGGGTGYEVSLYSEELESPVEFEALDEAVTYFLVWRRRLQLGDDFECGEETC